VEDGGRRLEHPPHALAGVHRADVATRGAVG
jgi:hypothetical protein